MRKNSWILSSVLTASLLRLIGLTDKRSDTVRVESLNDIQLRLAVQFQFSEHGHSGVARNSFRESKFRGSGRFPSPSGVHWRSPGGVWGQSPQKLTTS